ncbi:PDZ domain-containing protein [Stieleria sp. ICT_E10.1]|uniref:PDZ domain-containing protein n=1 Tax=Stieleria sedimenti TaxID=2976331 RepID=UPI00218008CA|nr:PDZ domain-containing protein [Stieleria sedimenti]MCS7471426.1 PDZ domain-containing protein [Stieleria sedimenti]
MIELDQFQADENLDPVDAVAIDGKPMLGVLLDDAPLGVEVVRVTDGLAGDRAGLIKGDKIVQIDEADVETPADAQMDLANHPLGSPLQLVYIRNNRRYEREIRFTGASDAGGKRPMQPPIESRTWSGKSRSCADKLFCCAMRFGFSRPITIMMPSNKRRTMSIPAGRVSERHVCEMHHAPLADATCGHALQRAWGHRVLEAPAS